MSKIFEKIDKELLSSVNTQSVGLMHDCIVYTGDYLGFKRQILGKLIRGAKTYHEYPFIGAYGITLCEKQIIDLAKIDNVKYISKQSKVFTQINVASQIMNINKFYESGVYGQNVTMAVIDTGVSPHLDFCLGKNRIIKFIDLINNKKNAYDDNGHGTFVTSIACGNGLVSNGKFKGIAPKANVIAIKALEQSGEAGAFKILEAMQWVYDNRRKYNIKVVCMSFGSSPLGTRDPLHVGAEVLWNEGIVVVAAAGNSGPEGNTIKSPGTSSKIITVGGLDDKRKDNAYNENNFEVAEFSSRGPAGYYFKPDLLAPAVNINGANKEGGYVKMSGTSVATPMIAGIACLIVDAYPNISPDQLKVRLLRACKKISGNQNEEGYGLFKTDNLFIK